MDNNKIITMQDLLEFIKTLGKEPGEYTDDEIYKIGLKHKKLLKGKSWTTLAKVLGVEKTGEQLRTWVLNKQKKDGVLPRNTKIINDKNIRDCSIDEISDNIEKQLGELYKERTKTRDVLNAYRRTLRDEARIESFKDTIVTTIKELDDLPYVITCERKNSNQEGILLFSDLHIGVNCDNFYNTYNTQIAQERVSRLVNDTIKYCKQNNVSTLNVLNLGDLIHGIIHTSARVEQDTDVIGQVMVAAEILARALNDLQQAAPKVIYRSVSDNHSRVIANKNDHIEKENLNRLIDWYLETRLVGTNVEFINDNLDIGLGKFTLKNGKNVVFAHGHQDNVNTALQGYIGATREFIDYILLAHYHSEKVKAFQGCKVIVNGSIVGTEQYALSKRLFNQPSQILLITDGDNLLNISVNLK